MKEWVTFIFMRHGRLIMGLMILAAAGSEVSARQSDSITIVTGTIYDESFSPVPACHVINLNTRAGTITDTLGIFRIPAGLSDTLLIRNIAFMDTLVAVRVLRRTGSVRISRRYYPLQEARVFPWGASYDDFREAVIRMPNVVSPGESLGLPRQDPGYIPPEMNESYIKNPGFLIKSPVSFFYQNFSRQAKSARRHFWLSKNQAEREQFNAIFSGENISSICGCRGEQLERLMLFLNSRMTCDYRCSELEIYTEIHRLLEAFGRGEEPD